jgi:hypothetical protein
MARRSYRSAAAPSSRGFAYLSRPIGRRRRLRRRTWGFDPNAPRLLRARHRQAERAAGGADDIAAARASGGIGSMLDQSGVQMMSDAGLSPPHAVMRDIADGAAERGPRQSS